MIVNLSTVYNYILHKFVIFLKINEILVSENDGKYWEEAQPV